MSHLIIQTMVVTKAGNVQSVTNSEPILIGSFERSEVEHVIHLMNIESLTGTVSIRTYYG